MLLFQLMEKQLETLGQHRQMVDARLVELDTTKLAIEEIEKLKPENETLIPLGSGIYTRARITEKDFLTELGANVMKQNSTRSALSFLDKRREDLEKAAKQIDDQAADITKKIQEMGPELQRMAAQLQQG
jgi:prefoldin alpha subunit